MSFALPRLLVTLAYGVPWVVLGCAVPRTPATLPPADDAYVAVLSGEMPGAISQVARHSWIVANVPGDPELHRFELGGSRSDPFAYFGAGDVAVHGIVHYERESIRAVVECLRREESGYHDAHPDYFPIPGPNSNTIVDWMLRHCDIHVELPATAIGRDYRGPIGASVTSRGTGVQLESWVAGIKVGLEEGVELHALDMALGVHFWPPGITVPVNPGRIGFDDSTHRASVSRSHSRYHERDRRYGVASLWMWSHYARVVDPESAGGITDIATVGFSTRGAYGKSLGYGLGLDLEAGMGFPPSFAYATRLYPAGLALMLGDNTFLGVFGGIGVNGVDGHVPSRFLIPAELRVEIDVAPVVRWGARMSATWYPGSEAPRADTTPVSFADEILLSTFLRIGKADPCGCPGRLGRGYFFALERGEVLKSAWVGASFGVEADLGG